MFCNTLQDVDQVGVDVNTVQTADHGKALHDAYTFGAELSPTKNSNFHGSWGSHATCANGSYPSARQDQ